MALDDRQIVEQGDARLQAGLLENVEERSLGVGQRECEVLVVAVRRKALDLLDVAPRHRGDHLGDLVVAHRLLVAEERKAGGEPPDVPGERADVRLVEVVHVEDEATLAVHVRAEVGRVEIALDPHPPASDFANASSSRATSA